MTTAVNIECFIDRQEIRSLTFRSPDGPVDGYQWRLLLRYPATKMGAEKTEWTPWVFGSNQSIEKMLAQWQTFLATEGHLAKATPPGMKPD